MGYEKKNYTVDMKFITIRIADESPKENIIKECAYFISHWIIGVYTYTKQIVNSILAVLSANLKILQQIDINCIHNKLMFC